jgi:hypothetical protein
VLDGRDYWLHEHKTRIAQSACVIGRQAEAILNSARGSRALAGRAAAIQAGERQVAVTIEYGDKCEHVAYDLVVVAVGFEARWFKDLLGERARRCTSRWWPGWRRDRASPT